MDRFQHHHRGPAGPPRYDREFRGRPGYDRGYRAAPYDRGYRPAAYDRGYGPPPPRGWNSYAAAFPVIPFGYDPMMGPLGWPAPSPYGAGMYGLGHQPPTPPRESSTYGRGGDRALREWAGRNGYDVEYSIAPRRGPRRPY